VVLTAFAIIELRRDSLFLFSIFRVKGLAARPAPRFPRRN
jgi:hypothetical protein